MTNIQKKNFNSSQSKPKSYSWSENFQEVRIESMGRNIVIPTSKISSKCLLGEEDKIPIYRAEADPNQRLDSSGVIEKRSKKGKEPMLYMNIGGDPKRTEDFMQQARERETKPELIKEQQDFQRSLSRLLYDINKDENFMKESNQYDYRESLNKAAKEYKEYIFDANGQTVRSSLISRVLATEISLGAISEHERKNIGNMENVQNKNILKKFENFLYNFLGIRERIVTSEGHDLIKEGIRAYDKEILKETGQSTSGEVSNVDTTKSHNQFGIDGNTLQKVKQEIAESGVQQGTTYNNRRRSEPMLYETKSLDLSGPGTRLDDVLIDGNVRGLVAGRR